MRWLAGLLLVVGCAVQGPDLDIDGIEDAEDDCVASFADEAIDADGDGKTADVDLCPHDPNAAAGDIDFDGIPDACDPFPGVTTLDTRRCITSFGVRHMNVQALTVRAGELGWNLTPPLTAGGNDTVSIISTHQLAYASTTIDVLGTIHFRDADATSNFRIWLRARPEMPSNQDVGCGIDGTNSVYVYADNARHGLVSLPAINGPFRLRGTVQSTRSGQNVLCRVTANGMSIATTFLAPQLLPAGAHGFASIATDVTIDSVVIDTRDDAVPL